MNGDVEQANIESLVVLLPNPLERLETKEQENEEKGEEEECGLNETERLGLVGGERKRKGIEGIEEVDMRVVVAPPVSGSFRQGFREGGKGEVVGK